MSRRLGPGMLSLALGVLTTAITVSTSIGSAGAVVPSTSVVRARSVGSPASVGPSAAAARSRSVDSQTHSYSPAAGPAATCTPNSEDTSVLAGVRCIAEETRSTRGHIGQCIIDPKALVQKATYKKGECKAGGLQAEAIAQARAVAQLNVQKGYPPPAVGGINPDIQWETAIPGNRPDLFIYDRKDRNGVVGLIEMKVTPGGTGAEGAERDMRRYIAAYPSTASGRTVARYKFTDGFSDEFFVTFGKCKYFPESESGYDYITKVAGEGLLVSYGTPRECPKRQGQDEEAYKGYIGADENANQIDDFFDWENEHPESWYVASRVPAFYRALKEPIKVYLNRRALIALQQGIEVGGEGAWPGLVAGLEDAAGTARVAILAGDAAALEMTGVEMAAAAELYATAAFITLTTAAVAAVVVLVVIATITLLLKLKHGQGNVYGEPHLGTLDGLAYDLQSYGEFHLLEVPSAGIDLQARFAPGGFSNATRLKAISVTVNGTPVEIRDDHSVLVNGQVLPTKEQWVDLDGGGALFRDATRAVIRFPGADPVTVAMSGTDFNIRVPNGVPTAGLLGNNDGIPGNDLVTSTGENVSAADPSVLHGRFADSWRITNEESSFEYAEDEDTDTHTDKSFPPNILTLDDFSEAERNAAATVCRAQNVPEGPQFDDCVFDIALTGDSSYAASAAAVTDFLQDPNARTVAADGTLTETYEAAIPANLRPTSTLAVPGGKAAGPIFDKSGYSFSVPTLPSHKDATVAFDLYVFGMRDGDPATGKLAVTVDGLAPVNLSFTQTAATVVNGPGQVTKLGDGDATAGPFSRYRVAVNGQHLSDQLRVSLAPSGFSGVLGTSLAVDNLAVATTLVPPQTFTLGTSGSVSDGVPGSGAGRIETLASHDVYSVAVAAGASEYLDLQTCPTGLIYSVFGPTKAKLKSGTCGDSELLGMAAGTYTIDVSVTDQAVVPALYSLALSPIQADVTGTLATNGTPAHSPRPLQVRTQGSPCRRPRVSASR